MEIHIVICDHCDTVLYGGKFERYRVEGGPRLNICGRCQQKPFRKVCPSTRATAVAQVIQMALSGWSPDHPNHQQKVSA